MTVKSTPHSKSARTNPVDGREIAIRAEPIELCQLLKFAGLAESGGEAKQLISQGDVFVNGVVETQKRKKIKAGDRVTYGAQTIRVTLS